MSIENIREGNPGLLILLPGTVATTTLSLSERTMKAQLYEPRWAPAAEMEIPRAPPDKR